MFQKIKYYYWCFFGWMAIIIGSLVGLSHIHRLFDPEATINVNGVEESATFYIKLLAVIFPLVISVLGVFIIRAKPFYPYGKLKNRD